jgi:hypothetical protein
MRKKDYGLIVDIWWQPQHARFVAGVIASRLRNEV